MDKGDQVTLFKFSHREGDTDSDDSSTDSDSSTSGDSGDSEHFRSLMGKGGKLAVDDDSEESGAAASDESEGARAKRK